MTVWKITGKIIRTAITVAIHMHTCNIQFVQLKA